MRIYYHYVFVYLTLFFINVAIGSAPSASQEAVDQWRYDRFGMFVHWGPISQGGQGELSHSRTSPSHRNDGTFYSNGGIDTEYYDSQYLTFNPLNFRADSLANVAKQTGMNYMVFTAKHHDGFSMYNTAQSTHSIMHSPFGEDIVGLLADACPRQGVKFGIYYSPRDWYNPYCDSDNHELYIDFYKAQMEELLSNYGALHELWFDGLGGGNWGDTSAEVMEMVRELQPEIMVNDRGGVGTDFYTTEHRISFYNKDHAWEACVPLNPSWGYVVRPYVGLKDFPYIMEFLLYTWGADGNMLLNIGPKGDGDIDEGEKERLDQISAWWHIHGERSIRGSRGGPYMPGPWGVSTYKGNRIYLHIFRWPSDGSALSFPSLEGFKIKLATNISVGSLRVRQHEESYEIYVPSAERGEIVTTVELIMDKQVAFDSPVFRNENLSYTASVSGSSNPELLHLAVDSDASTSWYTPVNDIQHWVQFEFDEPKMIEWINVAGGLSGYMPSNTEFQIQNENDGWETVHMLSSRSLPMNRLSSPVSAKKVRFLFPLTYRVTVPEFEMYGPIEDVAQENSDNTATVAHDVVMWLKTDSGIELLDGKVIGWKDQSGRANDLSVSFDNAPRLVESAINNHDVVRFDGLDDFLQSTELLNEWPRSTSWIFFVCKNNSIAYDSLFRLYPEQNPGRVGVHLPYTSGKVFWDSGGVSTGVSRISSPVLETGDFSIWAFVSHDGASNKRMEIWQNGQLMASQAQAVTLGAQGQFNLAWEGENGRYWGGEVAEIIVINRDLGIEEHYAIGDYLTNKYNISSDYSSLEGPLSALIEAISVTDSLPGKATLQAQVSAGAAIAQIQAFWGTEDGGSDEGKWENATPVLAYLNPNGVIQFNDIKFSGGEKYYYKFKLIAEGVVSWSNSSTFTAHQGPWETWLNRHALKAEDSGIDKDLDKDSIENILEAILGTNPIKTDQAFWNYEPYPNGVFFTHPYDPEFADSLGYEYQWSTDLVNWYKSGEIASDGRKVYLSTVKSEYDAVVSVDLANETDHVFLRLKTTYRSSID